MLANARRDPDWERSRRGQCKPSFLPDAFACFYDRYETAVVGYFTRRTRDTGLAVELTAETFAIALSASGRYRADAPTAATWLSTIAQSVLLKSPRRGGLRTTRGDGSEWRYDSIFQTRVGNASTPRASEDWVEGLLDTLPPDQRDAVRARIVEDRSYAELAQAQRMSEPVIRKRVSRGLASLRRHLERTP